jgi:hypothetical protein
MYLDKCIKLISIHKNYLLKRKEVIHFFVFDIQERII